MFSYLDIDLLRDTWRSSEIVFLFRFMPRRGAGYEGERELRGEASNFAVWTNFARMFVISLPFAEVLFG